VDTTGLEWRDERGSHAVTLASSLTLADLKTGRERRAYLRHRQQDLRWIRLARLRFGQGVSLVDLSAGGVLLDSPVALGPDSVLALEIIGVGLEAVVPFRVLRCEVGGLSAAGLTYRGACEFTRPIELPGFATQALRSVPTRIPPDVPAPAPAPVGTVLDLDLALKNLVKRVGAPGEAGGLSPAHVLQALNALQSRALHLHVDPLGERLGALLGVVVPGLERQKRLPVIIESELRRVVPQARLRIAGSDNRSSDPGLSSILISVPGAGASCPPVSIDLPLGMSLTPWQSRVLRITSRLIALLQRLNPYGPVTVVAPGRPDASAPAAPLDAPPVATRPAPSAAPLPAALVAADTAAEAAVWQKVVVRYAAGQTLKGYTQDFHASRPHFNFRSTPAGLPDDTVIVPLARLKAVFFVRDFDGNPDYVERKDLGDPQRGRRIEVTLNDDEVIVGTTLNYRSDGPGFFLTPVDPNANNIRVFVVANSVRQVRFPTSR
jgi:hypothetical protein